MILEVKDVVLVLIVQHQTSQKHNYYCHLERVPSTNYYFKDSQSLKCMATP